MILYVVKSMKRFAVTVGSSWLCSHPLQGWLAYIEMGAVGLPLSSYLL